jgi:hypothetical protein
MNLDYKITTIGPDKLRTIHVAIVEDEFLTTTRAKEVLQFVKNRNPSRSEWKQLKEAVRLGKTLKIADGD